MTFSEQKCTDAELLAVSCRMRGCTNYAADGEIYCEDHSTRCSSPLPPDLAKRKRVLDAIQLERILKNSK